MKYLSAALLSACVSALSTDPTPDFLKISGSNMTFRSKDVFLSGGNLAWSEYGYVTGTDSQGTLVDDLKTYLEYAAAKNVFVTLCLWNGALMRNDKYKQLYFSEDKLNSFIAKALIPLVEGLKG